MGATVRKEKDVRFGSLRPNPKMLEYSHYHEVLLKVYMLNTVNNPALMQCKGTRCRFFSSVYHAVMYLSHTVQIYIIALTQFGPEQKRHRNLQQPRPLFVFCFSFPFLKQL